jgi:hypothetical protein
MLFLHCFVSDHENGSSTYLRNINRFMLDYYMVSPFVRYCLIQTRACLVLVIHTALVSLSALCVLVSLITYHISNRQKILGGRV